MTRSKAFWARRAAGLGTLVLLLIACTPSVQTGDASLLPTRGASQPPNTEPPSPAPAAPASPTPTPSPGEPIGTLEFRVRDDDGIARPGVPVRYDGPASGTTVTGRKGIARVKVPPGSYDVEIPTGCVEELEIFRGSRANAVVYQDTRSVVNLRNIVARAGIWLSNPMIFDADPPWMIGQRVIATVTVIDRCRQRPARAGTSVSWLRWRPSSTIEMTTVAPGRSDADATVTIGFRCARAGVATMMFVEPVTGEREDLLRIRRTFDAVEPTCG